MKQFIIFFFLLISTGLFAQNIYKGGEGAGYDMGYFSSYTLNIQAKKKTEITISPNPINKTYQKYILIKTSLDIQSVEISDFKGIICYKIDFFGDMININFLSKGIYFLIFKTKNCILRKKIIVL